MVYVEGYDDIAFWRGVLSPFESDNLTFEISVPSRDDLAKGKKVLLSMCNTLGPNLMLCLDSDFDYLFQGKTEQSAKVLGSPYIIHTYAYAIENHRCWSHALHDICVKVSKNDRPIFDLEGFVARYSSAIYPLFLWYAYSALSANTRFFILASFKRAVSLGFVDLRDDGASTIAWVRRNVRKTLGILEREHPDHVELVRNFGRDIKVLGVTRENCYQYMNGHALEDNITVLLESVTDALKELTMTMIKNSSRSGVALDNEISNYKNNLRHIRDVLRDSEGYKTSELYKNIERDIVACLDNK